jgi:hypothetical protein
MKCGANRLAKAIRDYFFDIGAAVNNPSQPATIKVLTRKGWQSKRTTLANARAWHSYFQRKYPRVPTELVIHV